jgi:hypothetical protein
MNRVRRQVFVATFAIGPHLKHVKLPGTRKLPLLALIAWAVSDCATVPDAPPRLAGSSYGCMTAVVQDKVPARVPDKRAHCLAAGLIARYCSRSEAYLAGAGKEFRDLFTGGDAEWADWRADRAGIRCATQSSDDRALAACCIKQGY